MTLKEAVEVTKKMLPLELTEEGNKALTILLETCQLLLNSPRLVEDRKTEFHEAPEDHAYDSGWNACNEANRVARVKWLEEKLAGVEEVISDNSSMHKVNPDIKKIDQALRTHFTSTGDEVKTQEGK